MSLQASKVFDLETSEEVHISSILRDGEKWKHCENAVICLPSLFLGRLLGEALSTRERKCTGQRYGKWSQRCDGRLSFLRVSSCRQREKAPEVVPPAMQADLAIKCPNGWLGHAESKSFHKGNAPKAKMGVPRWLMECGNRECGNRLVSPNAPEAKMGVPKWLMEWKLLFITSGCVIKENGANAVTDAFRF